MAAAIDDHQFAGPGNLAAEADAARTHDAAIDEQRERVAHLAALTGERTDIGTTLFLAMLEMIVLQVALAGLVADRAVDRVVDQRILFDHRAALVNLLAVGNEDRAVLRRRLTSRHNLRQHHNLAGLRIDVAGFDQAHPATGDDGQPGMPTIAWNVDAGPFGHLDAVEASWSPTWISLPSTITMPMVETLNDE